MKDVFPAKLWLGKNRKLIGIIAAGLALLIIGLFLFATVPAAVMAQATATPTATFTPSSTATLTPSPIATGLPNPVGGGFVQYLRCGAYNFGEITPGACLQIYNGSDIEGFSAAGRRTYLMDAETGDVTIYGRLSQGPLSVKCVRGEQSITGSGTAIPATLTAAGISTPQFVQATLGQAITGDANLVSATHGSGVVTLLVYNSALTPVAASGAAVVDYEICGN